MKEYLQKREKSRKISNFCGIAVTVFIHAAAFAGVSMTGMTYFWPPSEENTFLLDFTEEIEPQEIKFDKEPVSPKPDMEKPVEVVQKSESPITVAEAKNETQEVKPDPFGDVEAPAPEPETPKIDPRASFGGVAKKKSSATTPHVSVDSAARFKAGQPDGNTLAGTAEGAPNANLKGREVLGFIQKPAYNKQESGVVIVGIAVDYKGAVQNAWVEKGTTITDQSLIQAAINSAYMAKFSKKTNLTADDTGLQKGTITYIFKLK